MSGPNAFPVSDINKPHLKGMTLRDWFAGQALANSNICTGSASTWEISRWFGPHRTGITRAEIIAKQAGDHADALLAARTQEKG